VIGRLSFSVVLRGRDASFILYNIGARSFDTFFTDDTKLKAVSGWNRGFDLFGFWRDLWDVITF
jgi:hypothetical protein